jgi:hypothetical protein
MTDRTELLRRQAELEAAIESRKTTSQLQSEALRGKRPATGDGSKPFSASHRQADALRRTPGGDDE